MANSGTNSASRLRSTTNGDVAELGTCKQSRRDLAGGSVFDLGLEFLAAFVQRVAGGKRRNDANSRWGAM